MMRSAFFVVLLQVCCSFQLNVNLNREIINDLRQLSVKVIFPNPVHTPGKYMYDNPSHCVGTFKKELGDLLQNVTQTPQVEVPLRKLLSNLKSLSPQPINPHCKMNMMPTKNPLNLYIRFLRKLNNGR